MITSLDYLFSIAQKKNIKRLAVAAAEDKFVLKAVAKAQKLGLIAPIFIGNSELIKKNALELNIPVGNVNIIEANSPEQACFIAVNLIKEHKADLLMKGLVSTNILLKQVVNKDYGLLTGELLSHLAIFQSPFYHKILGLSDAAMNISPDINEKKAILNNAVKAFHKLGIKTPKVALLAAIEKVNSKMTATTDADNITKQHNETQSINCLIDGPFALDNTISADAAKHKGIKSQVAGDADILIVPDIESGNILYKSLSFLGGAKSASIILGSKVPIVLTSRADSEETKFFSIVLGVVIASK